MVVVAGSGHLAYGSGIPRRTARRNGYDWSIILNDEEVRKGIADYVLFPESVPGGSSPRLMVLLAGDGGKVKIAGFPQESISEKAGMKAGDIILSIDDTPIQSVDDVKIDLLSRMKGDKVRVRILRETVLGGNREMDFAVVLQ